MEPSDAELLDRWQKGSREAGNELVERHYESLERFFVNKVPSGIGDLVHETFQAFLESRDWMADPGRFRSYLFSAAYNVLRGQFREKGRRGNEVDLENVTMKALDPGPRSILAEREERRLLLEGLRSIPVADQVLLELYYWESLKVAEIAKVLDIPSGTVKARLHRARQRLKAITNTLTAAPNVLSSTLTDLDAWARQCRREHDIERRIRKDWPGEPVPEALRLVRAVVAKGTRKGADYITIPLMIQWLNEIENRPADAHVGDSRMIAEIFKSATYLQQIGLLAQYFELTREDASSVILDDDLVDEALSKGELFDPDTGEHIEDWSSHVVIFYMATEALRELLRER